jgi:tetratricopeptide (TPR) repeat protein
MLPERIVSAALAAVACATLLPAQHHHEPPRGEAKAAVRLLAGNGNLDHAVTTRNKEARQFFNQGLAMVFGFNHGEAIRSFQRSAELDPTLAMAHWGIALALGPNINATMEPDAHKQAWEALQTAIRLKSQASPRERDYIDALSVRYTADPKADTAPLQEKYANAMRKLAEQYPDDLDAQTLFAESLMNLYPWKLWTLDGKPAPVTEEAVRILESVLIRDPLHIGANHYYIHAVEASPTPQKALMAADRLGKLAPGIGHLVHMPSHIYMRTGDYEAAAQANIEAAAADKAYLEAGGVGGFYRALYAHNLHFLSAAYSMQGRYKDSLAAAEETLRALAPLTVAIPGFEGPAAAAMLVPVRFRDWEHVLATPEPDPKQVTMHNLWHFARGMAYAGKGNVPAAAIERDKFREGVGKVPKDRTYGTNPERDVMQLAWFLLDAKIALASEDFATAIGHLKEAVAAEDGLSYNEPPDWYYPPSREALGAVLLQAGRHAEAESVFREDLRRNQRNGRSLFGLCESLKRQGKTDTASLIEPQYRVAWSKADRPLRVEELF